MNTIGIDPGRKGGVSILRDNGTYDVWEMPDSPLNIAILLEKLVPCGKVCIEKQWHRPGMAAGRMGSLIEHYGVLQGICLMLTKPELIHTVAPQVWKKWYWPNRKISKDIPAKERTIKMKADSIEMAGYLFPICKCSFKTNGPRGGTTIHDGLAEALLIARYFKEGMK